MDSIRYVLNGERLEDSVCTLFSFWYPSLPSPLTSSSHTHANTNSGTPMNTSHDDLKNQIRFLGYEHVPNIFNALYSKRSYSGRGKKEIDSKLLMYFLRPIMMRHSQEQKYRGTSTTLMSLPPKVGIFGGWKGLWFFVCLLSNKAIFVLWKLLDGTKRARSIHFERKKRVRKTWKRRPGLVHQISFSSSKKDIEIFLEDFFKTHSPSNRLLRGEVSPQHRDIWWWRWYGRRYWFYEYWCR